MTPTITFGPITLTLREPTDLLAFYEGRLGDLYVKLSQSFSGKWAGTLTLTGSKVLIGTPDCSSPETAATMLLARARDLHMALFTLFV